MINNLEMSSNYYNECIDNYKDSTVIKNKQISDLNKSVEKIKKRRNNVYSGGSVVIGILIILLCLIWQKWSINIRIEVVLYVKKIPVL